jgi:hypothetical protein
MATVFTQAHLPTPIGPASVGFFMGIRYDISGYIA